MNYSTFHNWIYSALSKAIEDDKKQNAKLNVLLEEYSAVRMSITEDQAAINEFIDNVCEIADLVNSDHWNGEDVMAIFLMNLVVTKVKLMQVKCLPLTI